MSKVKSIVITVLIALLIAVAAFFATVSFPVSNINRYNSMLSSIHLGGDLTGYVYTTLYPEGVISERQFGNKSVEEQEKYERVGGVYVDKETYPEEKRGELKADVLKDAEILSARYSEKALSDYKVSVEDGLTIKVAVPSNFSTAAYRGNNETSEATDLTAAEAVLTVLTVDGKLSIRTTESKITLTDGEFVSRKDSMTDKALVDGAKTYNLAKINEDAADFFTKVVGRKVGGNGVIDFKLSETGKERMKSISNIVKSISNSDNKMLYFFIGNAQVFTVPCSETIDGVMQYSTEDVNTMQNCAIVLDSVVRGNSLNLTYSDFEDVLTEQSPYGYAGILTLALLCLAVVLGVIVAFIVKYKKLGLVTMITTLIYAVAMIYAAFLAELQITVVAVLCGFIGLALLCVSNIIAFEEIRKQTKTGKTMQAAVKAGYKRVIMTVSDMHIVLFVIGILLAAISGAEASVCGLVLLIATLVSYVMYWFTRFMWYVISSPAKDKFRFGGYKREVYGDD